MKTLFVEIGFGECGVENICALSEGYCTGAGLFVLLQFESSA